MSTKNAKQPPKKRLNVVNIRLSDDDLDELKALAEAQARPLANYINFLIKQHLDAVRKGRTFDGADAGGS